MSFDGSYGKSVLLFFGETQNTAGGAQGSNMRLDRLDLSFTDIDTSSYQQSLNLLNYKIDGGYNYHYPATSAKICYHVTEIIIESTYTQYVTPMIFITDDASNPAETTFLMGYFIVEDTYSTLF